jgi:hypothetical protein
MIVIKNRLNTVTLFLVGMMFDGIIGDIRRLSGEIPTTSMGHKFHHLVNLGDDHPVIQILLE